MPTFCEKPVASSLDETIGLAKLAASSDVPVHIGFQRRFDRGYQRLARAVQGGELGFVHSIRAATHDQSPPHAAYIPTSGGIFRDCNVHDFDILRFVTGREVVSVYATGANKGEAFFGEAGDVDTAAAVLTLDDDTIALVVLHPLQRRRPRRAHGGPRRARAPWPSASTTPWPSVPPRRVSTSPRTRSTGPSWSASCRPTAPS